MIQNTLMLRQHDDHETHTERPTNPPHLLSWLSRSSSVTSPIDESSVRLPRSCIGIAPPRCATLRRARNYYYDQAFANILYTEALLAGGKATRRAGRVTRVSQSFLLLVFSASVPDFV